VTVPPAAPGAWPSSVTAEQAVAAGRSLEAVRFAGGRVWWSEARPSEGGRVVVCAADRGPSGGEADGAPGGGGAVRDLLPAPWNARSRVHEYGGMSWLPVPGGSGATDGRDSDGRADAAADLVFVELTDQRVHRLTPGPGATPHPLTPPGPPEGPTAVRYGDLCLDVVRDRVLAVREEHLAQPDEAGRRVRRTLVGIPLDGRGALDADLVEDVLRDVPATDFLAGPRISPDGRHLLWTSWDHPAMPWDTSGLQLAEIGPGHRATGARTVAGGPGTSILEADFLPSNDGRLLVVALSDETGWWRPTLVDPHAGTAVPLTDVTADFGEPLWVTGHHRWARLGSGALLTTPDGVPAVLPAAGDPVPLDPAWTWCGDLAVDADGRAALVVGGDRLPPQVVLVEPDPSGTASTAGIPAWRTTVLRSAADDPLPPELLPAAQLRTLDGVHVVVHPPTAPGRAAAPGTSPTIVLVHGGPTAQHPRVASTRTAYFTSRGFTVVGLDHRGSSGYGRAYRDALAGRWAELDVADAMTVARALQADRTAGAVVISGGSAGGLTVLATLTTDGQPFAAGTSSYGIADLVALGEHTHDFESRYLDGLLGPNRQEWVRRSPITRADRLATPVLLLQGGLDPVVPPEQAQLFADACAARGIPHALVLFPHESHGFRDAAARTQALEAELSFYGQVLGFDPPGVPRLPLA
jgi:alpha-beta hydrolase superfamily lysophospholipase